ncbi:MAG: hypothetical protein HRT58_10145 [Crocinitomicaceae bacterium]|nr:hypothetical protein [Flavobacteriales bacterium]NQZ36015.1 hypothetical protein [Crocinitomicaceae bacterium]
MLSEIVAYDQSDFSLESRYLWVWNPTNIPPHMGLSVDSRYFSLKANGVDLNSDLNDLIEIITRKKLPVLAIELNTELTLEDCENVFSSYERTIAHEVTCLNPIKTALNIQVPRKLSELLDELDIKGALGKKIAWNIEQSSIELPEYSTEDIHAYLVSLSK